MVCAWCGDSSNGRGDGRGEGRAGEGRGAGESGSGGPSGEANASGAVVAAQPAAAAAKLPGRTGGAYIPPFKLAQMLKEVEDKSSPEYQRMTWDALRKSINGLVNKVRRSSVVKQGTSARG